MKRVKRLVKGLIIIAIVLAIAYFSGPKVATPDLDRTLPVVSENLEELQEEVERSEAAISYIKEGNESEIIWFDSIPKKTAYSIVYLHGWSASAEEGAPIHTEIAKRYGCNLYLPRLAGHGLKEEEPIYNLKATNLLKSAKKAIAIAKQLGDQVIIMGTSTGATLALYLAGEDPDIAGLILFSPNVEIYNKSSKLLSGHWGLQLARFVKKGNYHEFPADSLKAQYWTSKYRVEALTHLQALIDHTMRKKTFERITQPVFLGYFYKNEEIQDHVISVPALLKMYETINTPEHLKRKVAFSEVNDHVIASYITSKDLESVRSESFRFLEDIIKLKPVNYNLNLSE